MIKTYEEVYELVSLENEIRADEKEQKILVFPRGRHFIQKLNDWITFDDDFYKEIAESFDSPDIIKPFLDKNHSLEESYGDIFGYEINPDGMSFLIKLNTEGRKLVKENSYRFISPSFGGIIDTKGVKHNIALVSISLTNIPALMKSIPGLQEQLKLEQEKKMKEGGERMDLTKLTTKLALQEDASIVSIAEAVQKLMDSGAEKEQIISELKDAIAKMTEENMEVKKAMDEVNEELSTIKKEELSRQANETIDLAIKNGQYHPALKDLKLKQFITDKESVMNELEIIPKIEEAQLSVNSQAEKKDELSKQDKDIMVSLDMNPENEADRKIYLEANKEEVRVFDGNTKEGGNE